MKIYVLRRDTEVITVKLRWKQVRILHGPATVMKEFCSGYTTAMSKAKAETLREGE